MEPTKISFEFEPFEKLVLQEIYGETTVIFVRKYGADITVRKYRVNPTKAKKVFLKLCLCVCLFVCIKT